MTKFCPRCELEKDVSEFVPNTARHDGLSGYCARCMAEYNRDRERRLRAAALALLGGECVTCGNLDHRVLDIDHIEGGGAAERRSGKRQAVFYLHVLRVGGHGYQLLCKNCNWLKYLAGDALATPTAAETVTAG